MKIFFEDKKLVLISSKNIRFDFLIEIKKSQKHKIKSIIRRNESLAEYTMENEISQLFFKYGDQDEIKRSLVI